MVDISKMKSRWYTLISRFNSGEQVHKSDIIELLESDEPIIDDAKPLLTATVKQEVSFKRGKKGALDDCSILAKNMILDLVPLIEDEIRAEKKAGQRISPKTEALEQVAEVLGMTTRALEKIIAQQKSEQ